ncbi:iron-containing alcohol dehydrogenase [Anaerovorax odorimutans]|uniref:Iron-containing alcohol dehydrogenase n=1 Tax=Anaerovorax odorimutans TaxID=109327 RepID=A0ABT1RUP0_9FIRM|nr:iron-containing alcohol dehydrogenase [Anaerovorax odorimutans]MCQ4638591.1 iron-containing alcohol dehydrogenase [Anaerovorax odorimutans]
MQKNFVFELPTKIEFGEGKILKTGDSAKTLGASRVILITDRGLSKTEIINNVMTSLKNADMQVLLYDDVRANPRDTEAQKAAEFARSEGADAVVACGGGSSMDLGKAVAALLTNQGDIQSIMKPNRVERRPAPLICIPTTAGTGSEVTSFAVLTIEKENRKSSIFDDKIRPDIAINDPAVLYELPSAVAAPTGMDALTHAIEAYTCKLANPVTDGLALQAMRYISESLPSFIQEKDRESCFKMMAGSLMAGIAFGFSDIAGVHCMAEALGGMYDTPHGVANSIFLPIVFEYNSTADLERHRNVALALGVDPTNKTREEIIAEAVGWLKDLSAELKIPSLKQLGYVNRQKFGELADLCMKNVSLPSNARSLEKADFISLFEAAYKI